jgi:NADPH:quinone reductase-like Zn-dependent oxidoreductase
MQAVRIHDWGGLDVLQVEAVDIPAIGVDEVLIRVRAAGINPVDWKMREGNLREWFSLPLILGKDVAGEVVDVGSRVQGIQVGDAVYGHINHAFAQFTKAKAAEIALKPATLDPIHAAAVPVAALTAWHTLMKAARLTSGQNVLVHGAAGGVGSFGVQFAHLCGAHVTGTASVRNEAFVRELGADAFIDYHSMRFEDMILPVDVVLDTVGGDTLERSYAVVKPGGTLVTIAGAPSLDKASEHGITVLGGDFSQPSATDLGDIASLIDAGRVKIHVSEVYPLAEVKCAFEAMERGHTRGKLVLHIDS